MTESSWTHWPSWAVVLLAPSVALAAPYAYIGSALDEVAVIDTANNAVVAFVPVGSQCAGIAVNPAGTRVYATEPFANSVAVIDTTTNSHIATVPVGSLPLGLAVDASGTRVYVAVASSSTISIIDTASNTIVGSVSVGTYPDGVVANSLSGQIYVTNNKADSISAIDAATNSVVATIPVGSGPTGITLNPAGTRAYVTNTNGNTVSIVDTATHVVVATVNVALGPVGIAVNPSGTKAYVANKDSGSVSVVSTASNTVLATVAVGSSPSGVSITPDGTRVYVVNVDSGNVSVIDTASDTVIATFAVPFPLAFGQFIGPAFAAAANYQGLWWNSNESGWGINLAHQSDLIYMTWYTYDATGKASWLAMLASKIAPNTYSGTMLEVTGSPYNVTPYNPAAKLATPVGSGTLGFSSATTGTFTYTAKGVSRAIGISKFSLGGPVPTCAYTAAPDFASATNYQDLWWGGSSQDGWGINLTHEGNLIYATWYTYDVDGSPLWLASLLSAFGPGLYTGSLLRASGPTFGPAFNPALVNVIAVGTATLTVGNGNAATWSYTVGALNGAKSLSRFLFSAPAGTICQ